MLLAKHYNLTDKDVQDALRTKRLIGEGINRTAIHIPDGWSIQGVINSAGIPDFAYLDVRDLTIVGPGTLKIDKAVKMDWHRMQFVGAKVEMTTVWDSKFIDCDFVRESSVALNRGDSWPGALTGDTNCNNIWFDRCTWENNVDVSLALGEGTTKVRVNQCKFHGPKASAQNIKPHLIGDRCYANFISLCNFMHGYQGISMFGDDNIILGNVFNGLSFMDILLAGSRNQVNNNSTAGRLQISNH